MSTGKSEAIIQVIRDVEAGEEFTVFMKKIFGKNNKYCVCLSGEESRNGTFKYATEESDRISGEMEDGDGIMYGMRYKFRKTNARMDRQSCTATNEDIWLIETVSEETKSQNLTGSPL